MEEEGEGEGEREVGMNSGNAQLQNRTHLFVQVVNLKNEGTSNIYKKHFSTTAHMLHAGKSGTLSESNEGRRL